MTGLILWIIAAASAAGAIVTTDKNMTIVMAVVSFVCFVLGIFSFAKSSGSGSGSSSSSDSGGFFGFMSFDGGGSDSGGGDSGGGGGGD